MKYVVTMELIQKILDYIGASTSTQPTIKTILMVDEIRALKPMQEEHEQEKEAQSTGE